MQSRTIRKQGVFSFRIYKFDTKEELAIYSVSVSKFFKESTSIILEGKLTQENFDLLKHSADDLAYQDLKLKIDDFFIYTKENLSLKASEANKKDKIQKFNTELIGIKKQYNLKNKKIAKLKNIDKYHWTPEEEGFLWSGTPEEVAKLLKKSSSSIYQKRKKYMEQNPNFIYPEKCKKETKQIKNYKPSNYMPLNYKPFLHKKWSDEDHNLLWSDSGKNLVSILNRTYDAIYQERYKYCRENPNFIIPIIAKFKIPKGFSNKIEEKSTLLENNIKFVEEKEKINFIEGKSFYPGVSFIDWSNIDQNEFGIDYKIKDEINKKENDINYSNIDQNEFGPDYKLEMFSLPLKEDVELNNKEIILEKEVKFNYNISEIINNLNIKPKKVILNIDGSIVIKF